eukprot:15461007-Alexandrium_andersonii.AAC.1
MPTHTWEASNGKKRRLDYVILPLEWEQYTWHAVAPEDFDLSVSRVDHLPSIVKLLLPPMLGQKWHLRKKMACDREALLDPSSQTAIDRELRALPPIPWE